MRLPGCFLCYTPATDAPPVAPLPALATGFVTFGSFNALAKQTPEVLRVWARILLALPDSRLVLKNKPFACEVGGREGRVGQAGSEWVGASACGECSLKVGLPPRSHFCVFLHFPPFPHAHTHTCIHAGGA